MTATTDLTPEQQQRITALIGVRFDVTDDATDSDYDWPDPETDPECYAPRPSMSAIDAELTQATNDLLSAIVTMRRWEENLDGPHTLADAARLAGDAAVTLDSLARSLACPLPAVAA